jgi:anti-sigma B factor antagonist
MSLVITRRSIGGVAIVELSGAFLYDEDGERLFREEVTSLVASGERQLLLDLSRVTHMDSGSVGTLVAVHLHALKRGGSLKLLNPSDRVVRVLRMTRLESIFDVVRSRGAGHEEDEGDEARSHEARSHEARSHEARSHEGGRTHIVRT